MLTFRKFIYFFFSQGDYRSGKRINNMRKVIPYIASNFRKDKIWLRRTKPHSRDYQVLLALDDSESIALAVRIEKIRSINHSHKKNVIETIFFWKFHLGSKFITSRSGCCYCISSLHLRSVGEIAIVKFGQNVTNPFSFFLDVRGEEREI